MKPRQKNIVNKLLKGNLPVIFFQEGTSVIAYTPALHLSTCGKSREEAEKRFNEAARLFFEELAQMGTLEQVLEENGWQKLAKPAPHWDPPQMVGYINQPLDQLLSASGK